MTFDVIGALRVTFKIPIMTAGENTFCDSIPELTVWRTSLHITVRTILECM